MHKHFKTYYLFLFFIIFGLLTPASQSLANDQLLGSYQLSLDNAVTPYNAQNAARALELINGTLIKPGQEFSYNDTVGMRTSQKGFISGMISSTSPIAEYKQGGGVCMTSSCLHQAIVAAGLEVFERHNHAARTSYLPLGDDAAVWFGIADYRFINNSLREVYIDGRVLDGNMWIGINSSLLHSSSRILPAQGTTLVVNEKRLNNYGPLYIENGTTLVPLELIQDELPVWVEWTQGSQTLNIYWGNEVVPLEFDHSSTRLFGQQWKLPVPARLINGQPFIPLHLLSKLAGFSLTWDETNRYILMDKIN